MKRNIKFLAIKIFAYSSSLFWVSNVFAADLSLPAFFNDNMMLQQQSQAAIWGDDLPNTAISVATSWGEKASTIADDFGKWKLTIATPKAELDKSYTIDITGTSRFSINNVQVGEVWLCSGQSNMDMPLSGYSKQLVEGGNEAIMLSNNNNIRLFKVKHNTSQTPSHNLTGKWLAASPQSTPKFSAVCYFYGKRLHDILNVPIGLIASAKGATSAESWTPDTSLQKLNLSSLKEQGKNVLPHNQPSTLYNAMIHPLAGYSIKGFLWYQGEKNRERASEYTKLLSEMISSWRSVWGNNELAFYYAQIAPFSYGRRVNTGYLREAQLNVMQISKNTGMAVSLDVGDCRKIHPEKKRPIAERLALWALAKDYQIPETVYSGPEYKSMSVENGKVSLLFDHAEMGFANENSTIGGFSVAGSDKKFLPANAISSKNSTVTVWSDKVEHPVAVRYAFENCPEATLFNTQGLPASSFRTDDWQYE